VSIETRENQKFDCTVTDASLLKVSLIDPERDLIVMGSLRPQGIWSIAPPLFFGGGAITTTGVAWNRLIHY